MPERFLHSKYSTVILIIVFLLIVIAFGRESYFNYQTDQEIKDLQKKIDELQKSNAEFSEMEKYFQSEEFLEKEAKLKLNLIRDGEKLIIVKQEEKKVFTANEETSGNIPNFKKWWIYFFGE